MNHMQETQLAPPQFRPGTGWGCIHKKRKPIAKKATEYRIEGEWLTLTEMQDHTKNTRRWNRKSLYARLDDMRQHGLVPPMRVHQAGAQATPATYAVTWADLMSGKRLKVRK